MARADLPHPVEPLEAPAIDAARLMLRPLLLEDLPKQRGVVILPGPLDRSHVDEVEAAVGQLGLRLRSLPLLPLGGQRPGRLLSLLRLGGERLPRLLLLAAE